MGRYGARDVPARSTFNHSSACENAYGSCCMLRAGTSRAPLACLFGLNWKANRGRLGKMFDIACLAINEISEL